MRKAVRIGDLVFVRSGDDFNISHLYPNAPTGKRFRITETTLSADEVAALGADPVSGAATPARMRLHLAPGEGYWCLILIDAQSREPIRSLGKIHDEVVSNILHYRTPEGTQFPEVSYDQIRKVRKARDEITLRNRTMEHMDDTRIIKETLLAILDELRKNPVVKQPEKPAEKFGSFKPRRKPNPKIATAE